MVTEVSVGGLPGVMMMSRRRQSRRARYRSSQSQYQYRLPDWVWGLALGVIVLIGVGAYFFLTGGGASATCDKALPPLPGNVQVTAEGFQVEDQKLGETIQYLNQGNLDQTFATFYGDVHAFTHNIDPDIREANEEMAKELCERVIEVEEDYDPPPPEQRSIPNMIRSTQALREHLRDVAEELGFPRPGG